MQKFPPRRRPCHTLISRFLICYLLVLVLPVGALDICFYRIMMDSVYANSQTVLEANLRSCADSIHNKIDTIERIGDLVVLDDNIKIIMASEYGSEQDRMVQFQFKSLDYLHNLLVLNADVNSAYIYNSDMLMGVMTESFFSVTKARSPRLFDSLMKDKPQEEENWLLPRISLKNIQRPELSPELAYSFHFVIHDMQVKRVTGHMELLVDEKSLLKDLYEQASTNDGVTCVVDDNGVILSNIDELLGQSIKMLGFDTFVGNKRINEVTHEAIVIAIPVPRLNVSLVRIVPLQGLYGDIYRVLPVILMVTLLMVAGCCAVFYLVTRKLLSNVPAMMRAMHQIRRGDFSTRIVTDQRDELGVLALDFNYMSEKLETLMNQVYETGRLEREAELHALTSSINPHFLYNSLATIIWMARASDNEPIVNTTQALARMYRLILSKGNAIIPFSDEMEIVKAYLAVQKVRYEERFEVEYEVEEEAMGFLLIKNIVQPLVENALEHGISLRRTPGRLWIRACVRDKHLQITIRDDGVGMTEERRKEVLSGEAQSLHSSGYAIRNILRRLTVVYEEEFRFELHSQPDMGTTVTITLPQVPQVLERR